MMNKKGQDMMLGSIIAVIIFMVAVVIIWQGVVQPSTELSSNRETGVVLSNKTTTSLDWDDISSVSIQGKGGVVLGIANYTLSKTAGTIKLTGKGQRYNTTKGNATYQYESDLYNTSGINRTIIYFILTFVILGVLAYVASLIKD